MRRKVLRDRKAQAAIEYLMVFGIALLLSTPFIMEAQSSILDLQSSSAAVDLRNSLNKMGSAIETVNAAGYPAKRTFRVELPPTVTSSYLGDRSVTYRFRTPDGEVNVSRVFEVDLAGNLPETGGVHIMSATATSSGVELQVVS